MEDKILNMSINFQIANWTSQGQGSQDQNHCAVNSSHPR